MLHIKVLHVYSKPIMRRLYNSKCVQLAIGFHYHHLGSTTLVISGEYVYQEALSKALRPSLVPRPHPIREMVWLHKPNFLG